jgi:aspartyl-tRNA synthetase
VCADDFSKNHQSVIERLTPETVISIEGIVRKRPLNTVNKVTLTTLTLTVASTRLLNIQNIQTGEIEVVLQRIEILNQAHHPLPFSLFDKKFNLVLQAVHLFFGIKFSC